MAPFAFGSRNSMTGDLDAAFVRLDRAITAMEADAGQRRALLDERERLYAEVARLSTDRAQLAQLLDSARAETRAMEAANQAVSQRLLDVMENIRGVLAGESSAAPG
jgi:chromosome segregation ATPase